MAERDTKGRFEKGHKGGPGRPRRNTEEQYKNATVQRVSLSDWEEIVDKAVIQAKRGDARAREWLSDHLIGKPQAKVDLTTRGEPLRVIVDE